MAGPHVIYGGPYAHESEAIIAEGRKKKPNFEKLIAGWSTITQGAVDAIELQKNPPEPFSGNFSRNVKNTDDENPEVPQVIPFTTPDEDIVEQGIGLAADIDDPTKVVTAPKEAVEKLINQPNDPDTADVSASDRDNIEQKNKQIDAKKAEENQAKDASSGSTSETKPSDIPASESIKSGEVKPVDVDLDKL